MAQDVLNIDRLLPKECLYNHLDHRKNESEELNGYLISSVNNMRRIIAELNTHNITRLAT